MRTPRPIPPHLLGRAFSREEALAAGITPRMLQHERFESRFPSVYCVWGTELDARGWIEAARLALPADARVSHETRLRLLGLELGDLYPLHFTVARDLHLDIEDVFLHRTVKMPPLDAVGVSVAASFVNVAATLDRIDLVAAGDWLLHRGRLDASAVRAVVWRDPWRPGAAAAGEVLSDLDGRALSLPESRVRQMMLATGLPAPEVNAEIVEDGELLGIGDLVIRRYRFVAEYEGRQHALDVRQFARDIDRYGGFRRHRWSYLQITHEMTARPRALMLRLYDELVRAGYQGPAPTFGASWAALFEPVRTRAAVVEQPSAASHG